MIKLAMLCANFKWRDECGAWNKRAILFIFWRYGVQNVGVETSVVNIAVNESLSYEVATAHPLTLLKMIIPEGMVFAGTHRTKQRDLEKIPLEFQLPKFECTKIWGCSPIDLLPSRDHG